MRRALVQVVRMRMQDVIAGDVANKNPDEFRGWFEVQSIEHLHNGDVALLASSDRFSINGSPKDIVGVQVRQVVEMPEPDRQASAEPSEAVTEPTAADAGPEQRSAA